MGSVRVTVPYWIRIKYKQASQTISDDDNGDFRPHDDDKSRRLSSRMSIVHKETIHQTLKNDDPDQMIRTGATVVHHK